MTDTELHANNRKYRNRGADREERDGARAQAS